MVSNFFDASSSGRRNARARTRVDSLGQIARLGQFGQVAFAQTVEVRICGGHVCDKEFLMCDSNICLVVRLLSG
jgi:hypothetical protein